MILQPSKFMEGYWSWTDRWMAARNFAGGFWGSWYMGWRYSSDAKFAWNFESNWRV